MDPEVLIRAYRDADEESVAKLWSAVFPNPAPRNVPHSVIAGTMGIGAGSTPSRCVPMCSGGESEGRSCSARRNRSPLSVARR